VTIFGVDIHPQYQAGISIEQIAREGFDFMSVKVSEAIGSSFVETGSADWIRRGRAAGLLCLGYHYLRPGNIAAQARVFADALRRAGNNLPGVIDAEALAADKVTPTLNIQMIREFYATARSLGADIPFLYLPRWYWTRIGSPNLAGLPPLWASSYPSRQQAPASVLYELIGPERWITYGGGVVGVLQFSETAQVAGRIIDVNAYPGRRDSFAALIGDPILLSTRRPPEPPMTYRIDPTPTPAGFKDGDRPAGDWPMVEHTIGTPGPVGGWRGRILEHFTPGNSGAFIQEAWSGPASGARHYVDRYDDKTGKGGFYAPAFVTQSWELPPGDRFLVLRLATRAYGSVAPEVER
jgi:hypothetical protein